MLRRSLTISLIRLGGTPIVSASFRALIPVGIRKSSRKTSPGWQRIGVMPIASMIVNDFDVSGAFFGPAKANPLLVIDPNAVLDLAAAFQRLKPVVRQSSKIRQVLGRLDHAEFSDRNFCRGSPSRRTFSKVKEIARRLVGIALNRHLGGPVGDFLMNSSTCQQSPKRNAPQQFSIWGTASEVGARLVSPVSPHGTRSGCYTPGETSLAPTFWCPAPTLRIAERAQ